MSLRKMFLQKSTFFVPYINPKNNLTSLPRLAVLVVLSAARRLVIDAALNS